VTLIAEQNEGRSFEESKCEMRILIGGKKVAVGCGCGVDVRAFDQTSRFIRVMNTWVLFDVSLIRDARDQSNRLPVFYLFPTRRRLVIYLRTGSLLYQPAVEYKYEYRGTGSVLY
jgi:hypothetical protein